MRGEDEEDADGCVCLENGRCSFDHGNFTSLKTQIRELKKDLFVLRGQATADVGNLRERVARLEELMSYSGVVEVEHDMRDATQPDASELKLGEPVQDPEKVPDWVLPPDQYRPQKQLPKLD